MAEFARKFRLQYRISHSYLQYCSEKLLVSFVCFCFYFRFCSLLSHMILSCSANFRAPNTNTHTIALRLRLSETLLCFFVRSLVRTFELYFARFWFFSLPFAHSFARFRQQQTRAHTLSPLGFWRLTLSPFSFVVAFQFCRKCPLSCTHQTDPRTELPQARSLARSFPTTRDLMEPLPRPTCAHATCDLRPERT